MFELYNAKRQYKNKYPTINSAKQGAVEWFDSKHLVYEPDGNGWEKVFHVQQKGPAKGRQIHVGWIKHPT